jgi:hypothetical protein
MMMTGFILTHAVLSVDEHRSLHVQAPNLIWTNRKEGIVTVIRLLYPSECLKKLIRMNRFTLAGRCGLRRKRQRQSYDPI